MAEVLIPGVGAGTLLESELLADDRSVRVGAIFRLDFQEAVVLTHDKWKLDAGGLPQYSFLLATARDVTDASFDDDEVLLLRVQGTRLCLWSRIYTGILHGRAGPIGGRAQTSAYGIGCRFNLEALSERIRFVGHLYDAGRIADVWCKDWRATLSDVPEWFPQLVPKQVAAYLDPPYVQKSEWLYSRSFESRPENDLTWRSKMAHYSPSSYLRRQMRFRWILSYDSFPALLSDPGLYAARRMNPDSEERRLFGVHAWRIYKKVVPEVLRCG